MEISVVLSGIICCILVIFLGVVPILAILDSKYQDKIVSDMFQNREKSSKS
ncbi:hypothetical protein [Turicibacter bilis]|uniref:hypothetical protein n=1 Tax=Turicibacter bilis TaxID=2735723 RepID=UPI001BB00A39|nr:hypothetical protein [Turicibacter bilis]MBS3199001.1 hypothetical protein [Turicibacter bilis]